MPSAESRAAEAENIIKIYAGEGPEPDPEPEPIQPEPEPEPGKPMEPENN